MQSLINEPQGLLSGNVGLNTRAEKINPDLAPFLFEAVRREDWRQVSTLLATNPWNIYAEDEVGETALHVAATIGTEECMKHIMLAFSKLNMSSWDPPFYLLNKQSKLGNSALHNAVTHTNYNCVALLLEKGAHPSMRDASDMAPLHIAADIASEQIVELLVQYPVDIDMAGGMFLYTPLHFAVGRNNPKITEILLLNGANPCRISSNGEMPIHIACKNGYSESLEALLNFCSSSSGFTAQELLSYEDGEENLPLHSALHSGDIATIKKCLAYGIDSNEQFTDGSLVHLASEQGNLNALMAFETLEEPMFKQSINTSNARLQTPLHLAASANHPHVLTYLLSRNAKMDAMDSRHRTPLVCAAEEGNIQCMKLLLEKGAKTGIMDVDGRNVFHHIIKFSDSIHEILELKTKQIHTTWSALLASSDQQRMFGTENLTKLINAQDNTGNTPMHIAASEGDSLAVEVLLQVGASPIVKNYRLQTAFFLASSKGYLDICKLLIDSTKAPLITNVVDNDGYSVLHAAASNGHHKIVHLLLERSTYIGRDRFMNTPIHSAAENGYTECIMEFDHLPEIMGATNIDKNTPLHLASQNGHLDAIIYLLNYNVELAQNEANEYFIDIVISKKYEEIVMAIVNNNRWIEILDLPSSIYPSIFIGILDHAPNAALKVLDRCVVYSSQHVRSELYHINYEFKYLETYGNHRGALAFNKRAVLAIFKSGLNKKPRAKVPLFLPLTKMVQNNLTKCLDHELSLKYLNLKWSQYGKYIYFARLMFYLLYVGLLTYIMLHIGGLANSDIQDDMIATLRMKLSLRVYDKLVRILNFKKYGRHIFPIAGFLFCCNNFLILSNLLQILHSYRSRSFWTTISNHLGWLLFISVNFFVLPILFNIPDGFFKNNQWQWGSFAVFSAWFNLLVIIQGFDLVGPYAVMFLTVLESLLRVIIVFVIPIVAFSLVFSMLNSSEYMGSFSTPVISLVRTFIMIMEGDYVSTFFMPCLDGDERSLPFCNLSLFFLAFFILCVPTLLLSVVISLAVGDIETVKGEAKLKVVAMRINLLRSMESFMPKRFRRKFLLSSFSYFPNTRKHGVGGKILSMWSTFEEKTKTVKSGRQAQKGVLGNKVTALDNSLRLDDLQNHIEMNNRMLHKIIVSMSLEDGAKEDMLNEMDLKKL